jgi:hypothetical protein
MYLWKLAYWRNSTDSPSFDSIQELGVADLERACKYPFPTPVEVTDALNARAESPSARRTRVGPEQFTQIDLRPPADETDVR